MKKTRYTEEQIAFALKQAGTGTPVAEVRLYREDGLSLRLMRPRRCVSAPNRERQPAASEANQLLSMDFVSDALFCDGPRLRALTVVDAYTREARGPEMIRVDNGPEFVSKALDKCAYENGVTLNSADLASRPTMPSWKASMVACATSA